MFYLVPITSHNYECFKNLVSVRMSKLLENEKNILMIGDLDESRAAGVAILKPEQDDMISLIYIYVDINLRNKGIGRFMIDSLVQFCIENELLLTCTFPDEKESFLFDIFNESGDFSITMEEGFRCSASLDELVSATSHYKIDKYQKTL